MRKYSLPLKIEVLSVANGANTKPLDVVGDEWLITDTYEDLFLKINHINEDGNCPFSCPLRLRTFSVKRSFPTPSKYFKLIRQISKCT